MINPQSEFVKSKIKGTKLTPRSARYIRQLITIERCITGDIKGLWTGHIRKDLENKYPHEYDAIMMELRPDLHRKIQEKQKLEEGKIDAKMKEFVAQMEKEDEEFRDMWRRLGGKLK